MIVKNNLLKMGLSINLLNDSMLEYPKGVWDSINQETKEIIADNLVYLKLSPYSMYSEEGVHFDFSRPYLSKLGDKGILGDIPRIAEEDGLFAGELISRFNNNNCS